MLSQIILAALALLAVAARPRAWRSAIAAAALAAAGVALAGPGALGPALSATAPMVVFLTLAIGLAALAVRAGLPERAADLLGRAAAGSSWRLFAGVCCLSALLTAAVSLDGAVVLMAPLVLELRRRLGAPLRPMVLGVVAVANSFSVAVPEGNPTNLVVIERLGLGLGDTAARLAAPGLAAALLCAGVVAWRERHALTAGYEPPATGPPAAAIARSGLVASARIAVQVAALLALLLPLAQHVHLSAGDDLWALLAVALGISALAALANNLPASAVVAAVVAPGATAYAALLGLSIGALATRQGSVATLIAADLTGTDAHARALLPTAFAAALVATAVMLLIA
jgi:arsenical pump membrane protein